MAFFGVSISPSGLLLTMTWWLFWRCKPSPATEGSSALPEGKAEHMTVIVEARESTSASPPLRGVVTASGSEPSRERFFRRHHRNSGRLLLLPAHKSSPESVSDTEARALTPELPNLIAHPSPLSSSESRVAYFTRGCYVTSGLRHLRLLPPLLNSEKSRSPQVTKPSAKED